MNEEKKPQIDFQVGSGGVLGGFFKGLSSLIDLADKVSKEGGAINKSGEFGVKGQKDMSGVYGFTIRTMAGPGGASRPVVRPFGDIAKVRKEKAAKPKGPVVEETREPLIDLFDEGNFVRVVAELPGVNESDIVAKVEGDDVLEIQTNGKMKYCKEIVLPAKVVATSFDKKYTNGILELKLYKKNDAS
jgi:HSP20 family protein